jgi:hypothetical protein
MASGNPLLKEIAQASGRDHPRSTVVTHLTRQSREPRHYAPVAAPAQFTIMPRRMRSCRRHSPPQARCNIVVVGAFDRLPPGSGKDNS